MNKLLAVLMPDEPEVLGLLALMLFQDSRRAARTGPDGELVLLDDQDRSLWDHARIDEGLRVLDRAVSLRRAGAYQLQAAIAAAHAQGRPWSEIVLLADTPEQRAARRAEAEAAVARIRGGEDFAAVAAEVSEAGTAERGGLLGAVGRGDLAGPLESAAFALA